jgi:tetratricopeptide (TPR) repeat protein
MCEKLKSRKSRTHPNSRVNDHLTMPSCAPRLFLIASTLALAASLAMPALAQHEGHDAGMVGWVPREILERPVPLREGVGTLHDPVTTSSPQAQAFYDQGLAYLHSFVWIEAARSFNQALRLDPKLAMAYVGLSDAYIGLADTASAHQALDKAQSPADSVTEMERRKIEIHVLLLAWLDDSDLQKYFAYRNAITAAITVNPNDPWLWIQRGFAEEGSAHAHGQNGGPDTIAFYEAALALAPDEFAAHHYLAHTYETIGRRQDALAQSEIYVRMAPGIAHAHHMHGHDLRWAGRTEEAIAEFERAEELEENYYRSENIPARYDWHHFHNLSLLAMCYETLGQMKSAEKVFRTAFELPVYNDVAEFNRRNWSEFLLGRGRYQEALSAAQELANGKWPMGRFAGHTMAGRALLRLNQLGAAQSELALAERELESVPSSVAAELPDAGLLNAEILLRQGQVEKSNTLLRGIEKKIRAVPGPDSWNEALFQLDSIASIARDAGDWDLAEFTAHQIIEHDPSYAGGYYALGLTYEHRGEQAAAREQFAHAEKSWSKADAEMPELVQVRQKIAALLQGRSTAN